MTISVSISLQADHRTLFLALLLQDIQCEFFHGERKRRRVILGSIFYKIIEMLVWRDFHRLSDETCCCRMNCYRAGQTGLCLSMTWKIFMDGHCATSLSDLLKWKSVSQCTVQTYETMSLWLLSFAVCLTLLRRVWLWFPRECPLHHHRML